MARQRHLSASQTTARRKSNLANKKPTSLRRHIKRDVKNLLFPYQPLDHTQHSFRLLRLYTGCKEDPIRCDMFNAVISDWTGKYTAGSYVWGSKRHRKRIFVDGHHFYVTKNLFDFLCACRLHHPVEPLTLWIDAICIDQQSIHERNHQVSIMAKIYQSAACTYSWLGHSQDDSDWLFNVLNAGTPRIRKWISPTSVQLQMFFGAPVDLIEWRLIKRVARAMWNLAYREYWKRIWIIQEVTLAPKLFLLCGDQALAWTNIPFGINGLRIYLPPGKRWRSTRHLLSSFWETTMFNLQSMRYVSLRDIHRRFEAAHSEFGHLRCSVAHDSVFALLGVAATTREPAQDFRVDYTLSIPELSIEVLRYCKYSHPLGLLTNMMASNRSSPSQIADWNHDGRVIFPWLKSAFKGDMEEFKQQHLVKRFSAMPGLSIYECALKRSRVNRFNICCYLVPNEPWLLADELYLLGERQHLIVRHRQFEPSKAVGIALSYASRRALTWQVNMIPAYLEYAERFMKALILREKPGPSSRNLELEVGFQHFKSMAWLSGALFGGRYGRQVDPYWKQNSKAMLKLFGYKPRQATWEAEIAAMLQFRLS